MAITGSGTASITGVSGTSNYSQSFTGLAPDSIYSYTCTPSTTATAATGTATSLIANTLPIIKSVTAVADATSITISWAATNQSDCSYSYVTIGSTTSSTGTYTIITGASKIVKTTNSFKNTGLSLGATYYYAITPYNVLDSVGTVSYVNKSMPFDPKITTFTFKSLTASGGGAGTMTFNVNISSCSSASIKQNDPSSTATAITLTSNAFNSTVDVPFTDLSVSKSFVLTLGGVTVVTKTITFTTSNVTYNTAGPWNTVTGMVYQVDWLIIGGGGAGGSAGDGTAAAGGNGGGAGGLHYTSTFSGWKQTTTTIGTINGLITIGAAGAGGYIFGGNGTSGYYGGDSSIAITLSSDNIDIIYSATGGKGGYGGSNDSYVPTDYGGKSGTPIYGNDANGNAGTAAGIGGFGGRLIGSIYNGSNGYGGTGGYRVASNSTGEGNVGGGGSATITIHYITTIT